MYQNFIGIDMGKDSFYVAIHGEDAVTSYSNTPAGFDQFYTACADVLKHALVVVESTGGYERALIHYVQRQAIAIHRANARRVKHFIRSFGQLGKSDRSDARGLAHYGKQRQESLALYEEHPDRDLLKLVTRRHQIKQMLVQEKNRLKAPDQALLKKSYQAMIAIMRTQLAQIDDQIKQLYENNEGLQAKRAVLKTVPGIGDITATELLALLPELGKANRKQIASLSGLAPHPNESGRWVGHRYTRGGRATVKPVLFMAAMSASRGSTELGQFYERLVGAGKKKMVAMTALMRKIVVIANARVRDFQEESLLSPT